MEVHVDDYATVTEVTHSEFNSHEINRIKKEYGALRQMSKGPT